MFDPRVPRLAGITRDQRLTIIHYYSELKAKFMPEGPRHGE